MLFKYSRLPLFGTHPYSGHLRFMSIILFSQDEGKFFFRISNRELNSEPEYVIYFLLLLLKFK
jgi:hypothetical protein